MDRSKEFSRGQIVTMIGAPVAFGLVGLVHPVVRGDVVEVLSGRLTLWLVIHVLQIPLVIATAAAVWLLLKDLQGRAATVARVALVPFVAFYSAFDALIGIATGLMIRMSGGLPAAADVARTFWASRLSDPRVGAIVLPGDAAWVTATLAAAIALRHAKGPTVAVVALVVAAILFGIDHVLPFGPPGMAALAVAAWARAGWTVKSNPASAG